MSETDTEMRTEYDFSEARRGPVIPPAPNTTRITLRLDDEVIEWFRQQAIDAGGGLYTALINEALKEYIRGQKVELPQRERWERIEAAISDFVQRLERIERRLDQRTEPTP